MTDKIKIGDLPDWDPAEFMADETLQVAILNAALESFETDDIADTLGDIVRARGMNMTAETTGITRRGLNKSLKIGGNPRLSTVMALIRSFGFELSVRAVGAKAARPKRVRGVSPDGDAAARPDDAATTATPVSAPRPRKRRAA